MATSLQEKTHNFGIFTKNGKRAILQIDFPGTSIYLIKRGHIKKTFYFDSLKHFDSEEGLHIVLNFKEGAFEFDADNTEEKYTICRLLSVLLNTEDDDSEAPPTPSEILNPVKVIKEGIIEKKGNTTITTWNKRRLQITAGEFSYYKPGDQLALNIIQIWNEICHLKKVGQGCFTVKVRDREYVFRVISDSKTAAESEREQWMRAFHVALRSKRTTLMFLDSLSSSLLSPKSDTPSGSTTFTFPQPAVASNRPNGKESRQAERERELESIMANKPGLTARVSVHLSYVEGTERLTPLPTSSRPKPPAYHQIKKPNGEASDVFGEGKSTSAEPYEIQNIVDDGHIPSVASVRAKWQTIESSVQNGVTVKHNGNETFKEPLPDYEEVVDVKKEREQKNNNNGVHSRIESAHSLPTSPSTCPPPPPLEFKSKKTGVKLKYIPKTKLKPVHWSKISQMMVAQTIWKDVRDVTERLDRSLIESQFCQSEKETVVQAAKDKPSKNDVLLDPKRAQNLGIMFAGLKTDVINHLKSALQSTVEIPEFPADKLRNIRRYQPTADDVEMYKEYRGSRDRLHTVDKFMMDLCEIPNLSTRLDLVLTILDFPSQFTDLSQEVSLVRKACEELNDCPPLVGVLEYLLSVGNYLNAYTSAGIGAHGFQITSIDKVLDVRGRDLHYSVVHLLVDQVRQTQPDLLDWTSQLQHVSRCADLSVVAITAEVEVLKNDLNKIRRNMKLLKPVVCAKQEKKFFSNVQNFLIDYDRKVVDLETSSSKLLDMYRRTLVLFGEAPQTSSDVFFSSFTYFMEKFQAVRDKNS